MQFVRTAQFKHKNFLALSTVDGGPRPPRPELVYNMYQVCMYFVFKKIERSGKIIFYIVLKLNDHPTRCFNFGRIHPNGCMFGFNF